MKFKLPSLLLLCLSFTACASPPEIPAAMLNNTPRSILVLPPLDQTVETDACYGTLGTVTTPLAEAGYYVFPVAVVDQMMRENGLPTAHDMHQVPLDKLNEIFAPDAVLYLTVTEWGTSYEVLSSNTRVGISGKLVDAQTGGKLWAGEQMLVQSSGSGGGGIIGALAGAVVNQVATSIHDPSREVARNTSWALLNHDLGLVPGVYRPDREERLAELTEGR